MTDNQNTESSNISNNTSLEEMPLELQVKILKNERDFYKKKYENLFKHYFMLPCNIINTCYQNNKKFHKYHFYFI